jgi:hypothetical protein
MSRKSAREVRTKKKYARLLSRCSMGREVRPLTNPLIGVCECSRTGTSEVLLSGPGRDMVCDRARYVMPVQGLNQIELKPSCNATRSTTLSGQVEAVVTRTAARFPPKRPPLTRGERAASEAEICLEYNIGGNWLVVRQKLSHNVIDAWMDAVCEAGNGTRKRDVQQTSCMRRKPSYRIRAAPLCCATHRVKLRTVRR